MAEKFDLVVQLTADMKGLQGAIGGMTKGFATFGLAVNGVQTAFNLALAPMKKMVSVGKELYTANQIQVKAEKELATALKATGNFSEEAMQGLKDYASGLQSITTFGDEAILSAQRLLGSLGGLDVEGIKQLTPGILNMASAMNMDLNAAFNMVAKTTGSTVNALGRYGIQIDGTASKQEKVAQITDQLNEKFKGFAEALATTTQAGIIQIQNIIGDIKESLGGLIDTLLKAGILDYIKATALEINNWAIGMDENKEAMEEMGRSAPEILIGIINAVGKTIQTFKGIEAVFQTLRLAVRKVDADIVIFLLNLVKTAQTAFLKIAELSDKVFKTQLAKDVEYAISQTSAWITGIEEEMADLENQAIKTTQGMLAIGEGTKTLVNNIEQSAEGFKKAREEAQKLTGEMINIVGVGGVMADISDEAMGEAINKMKNHIERMREETEKNTTKISGAFNEVYKQVMSDTKVFSDDMVNLHNEGMVEVGKVIISASDLAQAKMVQAGLALKSFLESALIAPMRESFDMLYRGISGAVNLSAEEMNMLKENNFVITREMANNYAGLGEMYKRINTEMVDGSKQATAEMAVSWEAFGQQLLEFFKQLAIKLAIVAGVALLITALTQGGVDFGTAFSMVAGVAGGIQGFAKGGRVDRPQLAMVGEEEPETIIPDSKMDDFLSANAPKFNIVIQSADPNTFVRFIEQMPYSSKKRLGEAF